MWQRPSRKERRKESLNCTGIKTASSLASKLSFENGLYFQPNQSFIRG
jgi:hypothetical protein